MGRAREPGRCSRNREADRRQTTGTTRPHRRRAPSTPARRRCVLLEVADGTFQHGEHQALLWSQRGPDTVEAPGGASNRPPACLAQSPSWRHPPVATSCIATRMPCPTSTSRMKPATPRLDLLPPGVQKTGMTVGRAGRLRSIRIVAAVVLATLLASCTGLKRTVGGWLRFKKPAPETTESSTRTARVYYAAVDGLKVYSEPSASSKVVGTLSLHEKVTRSKVERGYAYVESTKSVVKGWVDNAGLTWRSPTAPPAAASTPGEPKPEEPAAPPAEDVQAPVAPQPVPTNAENSVTSTTVPAPPR